jgi:hypothetical protein
MPSSASAKPGIFQLTAQEIVHEFALCETLSGEVLAAGIAAGIPWAEIAKRVEVSVELGPDRDPGVGGRAFHGPRLARVVFLDGGLFEFAEAVGEASEGVGAMILLAMGEGGDEVDLVAWSAKRQCTATWLGRAAVLGAENLHRYQPFEAPIVVHFRVEAWLRGVGRGVLVLDEARAGETLRRCARLAVDDLADLDRLERMLRPRMPNVVVRKDGKPP